jgi:ammonia channel protein AmtB
MTFVVLWITDKTVGLRVSPEEEAAGLDVSLHDETGYEWPGEAAHIAPAPGGAQPQS